VTRGLPVYVVSGGGTNGTTLLYSQAVAIAEDNERPSYVLYVGDLDEHGAVIEDRVADDLSALVSDLGGSPPAFVTVAITAEQATRLVLPQNPDKPGEWQAEALPPDVLAQVVRVNAEAAVDLDALKAAEAQGAEERKAILKALAELKPAVPEPEGSEPPEARSSKTGEWRRHPRRTRRDDERLRAPSSTPPRRR
jgi:hypothetical protein